MTSTSEWEALAGAVGIAYLLATLRLRVDLGNPSHAVLFAVVFFAGGVLVLAGLSPPDLRARLLRFRLSSAGRAAEWSAAVAVTLLTWLALGRPLAAVALAVGFGYFWFHREDYYDDLRAEVERLDAGEASAAASGLRERF